jgi:hypothetical protein
MLHEVKTAVKGEFVSAQLPPYAGKRKVRAAKIVALGMGQEPGTTRLALEGGAHVDVGKAWMQKNGARAGQYYVQNQDDTTEAISAEVFESSFTLAEEDAADEGSGDAEGQQEKTVTLDGEQVKVSEIEGAFKRILEQNHTLTNERDGARARITELEKELADANARNQLIIEGTTDAGAPSAEDLDKHAADDAAKDATSGATETQEGQS